MQIPGIADTIGGMSAVENVQAALEAIDRHSDLNAFITVHQKTALKRARELDESEPVGVERQPETLPGADLKGIHTLKSLADLAGFPEQPQRARS